MSKTGTIVSASRRTDIPAFYTEWFMRRIAAGYCLVPNPLNPRQVSRVSLAAEDTAAVCFWTRHAAPLLPRLAELDTRGFRYFFLYTLLDYPRVLDSNLPRLEERIAAFAALSDRVGPDRVIWRYDPIVLSSRTDAAFHCGAFKRLAAALSGRTRRCIISLMDVYRKLGPRLRELAEEGVSLYEWDQGRFGDMIRGMVEAAGERGIALTGCSEKADLPALGVPPGGCIDAGYIGRVLGANVSRRKDPSQRERCRCAISRDIGMYDTCPFGCRYCYATSSLARARENHRRHDPRGEALLPVG